MSKCIEIIKATGVDYAVESRGGAYLAKSLMLRYLSMAVTAVMVIAALIMARSVCFKIEIDCENVDVVSQVKNILAQDSIRPYMLKSKINTKALSKRISGEIEEVGFANCYFDGGKLTVQIKEVHVKEEEEEYSKIVADRDCIITRVLVYSGTALVKAGDVVKKGDTLIEGYIDTAHDTEENERLTVPADGLVYAETAYVKRITIGDKVIETRRTGESWKTTDIYLFGKLIGKSKLPEYEQYQTVEEEKYSEA